MANKEISQEQIDQLIEDARYLQSEAEALKYVIDEVPYNTPPPEGRSIAETLLLLDHAQLSYFRPIFKKAVENPRPTYIDDFDHFEESFEADEEKLENIQKLLSKLSKHRAGVVNTIHNISLINWETVIYENDKEILLYNFALQMVHFDQQKLKEIADLVMIYKNEEHNNRTIQQKQSGTADASANN
jgi:hypothetical protein